MTARDRQRINALESALQLADQVMLEAERHILVVELANDALREELEWLRAERDSAIRIAEQWRLKSMEEEHATLGILERITDHGGKLL